ncbi:GntR family transcriptional regulator [Amycolatopsis pithecellobii]|uniref:GntR family transcriptional regulator n=1 Tax=Amycolatopsis pithecellobii TaxID=664692 RepID=A0A6N7YS48_9PSEU|nr:GntR family transcriptional regulator [Amycolatopsis pithecellobii]MTD54758.1 GntR family transcriptional regulator [Amycolatopsis pithecellobii]
MTELAYPPGRRGRKPVPVPDGIQPLAITNRRECSPAVHAYLRDLILTGVLRPGDVLAQSSLAPALGVSRTPVREAMRMLMEEGLLDGQVNQQARVSGFDTDDLDSVFAGRIVLETLAIRATAGDLGPADADVMLKALVRMAEAPDRRAWHLAHRALHDQVVRSAPPRLRELLGSFGDRCEQYIELLRSSMDSEQLDTTRFREHQTLVEAVRERRFRDLEIETALHRARTATLLLSEIAPEFDPVSVESALGIVRGRCP